MGDPTIYQKYKKELILELEDFKWKEGKLVQEICNTPSELEKSFVTELLKGWIQKDGLIQKVYNTPPKPDSEISGWRLLGLLGN